MVEKSVSLEDIEKTLRLLGGKAHVSSIKKELLKIYGGLPSNYSSQYTFNNTIQKIVEDYCPQSANYKVGRRQVFRRIDHGLYELISEPSLIQDLAQLDKEQVDETTRKRLIDARLGQGNFRERLIEYWMGCAVTGLTLVNILRASHIKPWHLSSNFERLDAFNGLLLSPNMDALFDQGYISFTKQGFFDHLATDRKFSRFSRC